MAKAKNSKGLFRRGKIWWIRYTVNGSQTRESSTSALKADAEYLLATRIKAIGEGTAPTVTNRRALNTTFAELADRYLDFIQGQKAVATKKGFIQELKAAFGSVKLNALTLAAVEIWQARLMNEPRQARSEAQKKEVLAPLAVASVNRRLACLKHMLTKAVDWELIGKDTLDRLRRVKLTKEENRRSRFLSAAECRDLIAAAPKHLKPVLIFALNTGCRKGEILGLTWDRVDLKHGFIRLDKTKSGTGRDIPINNTLAATLQGLIRRVDSPLVFYNPATGGRWHDLKRPFATACSRTKLQDFRFHDLRHTFASQLVMAGVDLTTVSRLLGHASLTMTLRYSHLAPDHLKSAVDLLNRLQDEPLEIKKAAN
jgi:integrase